MPTAQTGRLAAVASEAFPFLPRRMESLSRLWSPPPTSNPVHLRSRTYGISPLPTCLRGLLHESSRRKLGRAVLRLLRAYAITEILFSTDKWEGPARTHASNLIGHRLSVRSIYFAWTRNETKVQPTWGGITVSLVRRNACSPRPFTNLFANQLIEVVVT
jgi:hypothetical protein